MIIGNKNTNEKVVVIAEIGNNHEGDFETAVKLVHEAADCGVDGVKFQTYKTEHFISKTDPERFARLKSFELTHNQFKELSELAHSLGILFISTPLDIGSAIFLESIVDAYKIASGDINFYPLLDVVKKTKKPIIISTGASDINQIGQTIKYIQNDVYNENSNNYAILHCVSCYPAPYDQINLHSLGLLSKIFDCDIGYSDHTIGIDASLTAVALGARIIEKHFTLDKSFSSFRDHQLSSDPKEMRELIQKIKHINELLGQNGKKVQPCEKEIVKTFRRSIVAGSDLTEGTTIEWSDIIWTRPAGGIPPGEEGKIIGKKIKNKKKSGEMILENDVE